MVRKAWVVFDGDIAFTAGRTHDEAWELAQGRACAWHGKPWDKIERQDFVAAMIARGWKCIPMVEVPDAR